jgi:chromosome condensin MukBEF ATPase and DNA-binding subunit MukB
VGIRSCYTVARDWKERRRFVLEAKRQWTLVLELAYDGRRLEAMEVDYFGSWGPT